VPGPAVTPADPLFNVVAGPGARWRHRRDGALRDRLARRPVPGPLPGVVPGAGVRVFALPGPDVFRLLIAALVLRLRLWWCLRATAPAITGGGRGRGAPAPADRPGVGGRRG
jgi:hypothetical protein